MDMSCIKDGNADQYINGDIEDYNAPEHCFAKDDTDEGSTGDGSDDGSASTSGDGDDASAKAAAAQKKA